MSSNNAKPFPILRLTRIALAAALMGVATFIRFPLGFVPVMFTAQVYMVLTVGLLLGGKDGAAALCVYLLIGFAGVPVFSRGGGLGTLTTPEAGYLFGFILAAFTAGAAGSPLERRWWWGGILAAFAGIMACYIIALPYIAIQLSALGKSMPAGSFAAAYCLPFLPLDAVKAVLAGLTSSGLKRAAPSLFAR
jgi:biotin transport system substrate-specific component